ncbi:MAG TPA: hypothetical protein VHB20_08785 [Verrucomicrobiae bacterium]|jgi:hypothetical protein|nr:hypothetical protein [Verrucomicrobiae bacterium]
MKTAARILLLTWIVAASSCAQGGSLLAFSDTWKNTIAFDPDIQGYVVKTTGAFHLELSVPLHGTSITYLDEGSGEPTTAYLTLTFTDGREIDLLNTSVNDATFFSPAARAAKFLVIDFNTGDTLGAAKVTWSKSDITVDVTSSRDLLGEAASLANSGSQTIGGIADLVWAFGDFYYENPQVVFIGRNTESHAQGKDGSGPFTLESGSLTGKGNTVAPKLKITAPASGMRVYDTNAVIHLTGTASDPAMLASLQIRLDDGEPVTIDQASAFPTNALSWSATVPLPALAVPGPTTITVTATDISGNSTISTLAVDWIEFTNTVLTFNAPDVGAIKGLTNGQPALVGHTYAVQAQPANTNWIFAAWTDGFIESFTPSLNYLFRGTPLTASFVPNPFRTLRGPYTALFVDDPDNPSPQDCGYITINVDVWGVYSGKLFLASRAKPFALSGRFMPYGTARNLRSRAPGWPTASFPRDPLTRCVWK